MSTLTELAKKLREADIYESQPDQSGNNIGRYVATDLPHDVADRLEAIEKAWAQYWLELDAPVRDPIMIRLRRAQMKKAVEEGTES